MVQCSGSQPLVDTGIPKEFFIKRIPGPLSNQLSHNLWGCSPSDFQVQTNLRATGVMRETFRQQNTLLQGGDAMTETCMQKQAFSLAGAGFPEERLLELSLNGWRRIGKGGG